MRWSRTSLVVAALAAASSAFAQPAGDPAEAYGRLPALSSVSISPDGRMLILIEGEGDAGRVSIHRIEDDAFPQVRVLNAPAGGSIRGADFADDRYALVTISQTFDPSQITDRGGYVGRIRGGGISTGTRQRADAVDSSEFVRQLTVNIATGETAFMLSNARHAVYRSSLGAVSAPIVNDEGFGRIFSVDYGADVPVAAVYRVNLSNGLGEVVYRGARDTWQVCLDAEGRPYARADYDEDAHRWTFYAVDGRSARRVASGVVASNEEWNIPTLRCRIHGRPEHVVAVSGYEQGADRNSVQELDLNTGTFSPLRANDTYDLDVVRDPYSREVIGFGWTGADGDVIEFIDAELSEIQRQISERFHGGPHAIQGWDRGRNRFIVSAETPGGPATFLFERAPGRLRLIGHQYPELAQTDVPQRQSITYRARDGVRIPAFLTLPPDVEARGLPLVVMPHGGPHAQNQRGFDWWAGFMASRGYAVLEPDFRGSTGYGRAWQEAGHGNWGNGVMQHDVTDGVRAMIASGMADADRVCIVGASYGGYAALAGAAFTPDLYACAVSVAGVSDMRRMFLRELQVAGADSMTSRFWSESMGRENFERDSPAQHVQNIQMPVLLIHGADDTVVPFNQSTWMERRMREAGKDVRLVELRGDDHWLSDASTRTQMLREIDAFLGQHLRAGQVGVDDRGAPSRTQ